VDGLEESPDIPKKTKTKQNKAKQFQLDRDFFPNFLASS
jgi:hypothetical protein